MKAFMRFSLAVMATMALTTGWVAAAEKSLKKPADRPRVEVVFVLDTTGSMGGLIEGAKRKIWSIADSIASGLPVPLLKIGLVAYRDRGDAYVTRRYDLTEDLDKVFGDLRSFSAAGGGDTPESVNQALYEAVHKMSWSPDDRPLKIIYLVGDAPPHMDYRQDVKYLDTCKAALKASIMINTVQCGNLAGTRPVWQEIARSAEGKYIALAQNGGMVTVATPYDKKLAALSRELSGTYVAYGSREERQALDDKMEEAERGAAAAPAPTAAARASYKAKAGRVGSCDLIAMLAEGKLSLAKIDRKHLPEDLKALSGKALEAELDRIAARRKAVSAQIRELSQKRNTFLKDWRKKAGKKDSFDGKVLESIKKAAEKKGIKYSD